MDSIDKSGRDRRAAFYMSTNLILTSYTETSACLVKYARRQADLDVWVERIDVIMGLDSAAAEEHYLAGTTGQ